MWLVFVLLVDHNKLSCYFDKPLSYNKFVVLKKQRSVLQIKQPMPSGCGAHIQHMLGVTSWCKQDVSNTDCHIQGQQRQLFSSSYNTVHS